MARIRVRVRALGFGNRASVHLYMCTYTPLKNWAKDINRIISIKRG